MCTSINLTCSPSLSPKPVDDWTIQQQQQQQQQMMSSAGVTVQAATTVVDFTVPPPRITISPSLPPLDAGGMEITKQTITFQQVIN